MHCWGGSVMSRPTSTGPRREIVTLADLAPRGVVEGRADRRVFGAEPVDLPTAPGYRATDGRLGSTRDGRRGVLAIANRDARRKRPVTR
jgi:hypothetical protein